MLKSDYRIDPNPTDKDFEVISEWLHNEYKEYREGFYVNINPIENSFLDSKMIILKNRKEAVGFLTYHTFEFCVEFDIFVINHNERQKGLGRLFLHLLLDYFGECNYSVIKLYCAPKESKYFWEKMNFIKIPNLRINNGREYYYKSLIKEMPLHNDKVFEKMIELWDVDKYHSDGVEPKWIWEIKSDDLNAGNGIVFPCECDWNMRVTIDGECINEDKVKYITGEYLEVYTSPFLYIESIHEFLILLEARKKMGML